MSIKFLNVNVDSTFVLTCLTSFGNLASKLFPTISNCRMLLNREWVVHLHHIYNETNSVADGLVKWGRMQVSFLDIKTSCECHLVTITGHLL